MVHAPHLPGCLPPLPPLQWYTLLICLFAGYSLLGLEAISLEIEQPFGRDFNDLPLGDLALSISIKLLGAWDRSMTRRCGKP